MASRRKKAAKSVPFSAADLSTITKANPYIQRLIEDAKLRDNVRTALDSGRSAYDRLLGSKAPHKALLEDAKLQRDLRQAADAVRDVTVALSITPAKKAKKKGRRLGRKLMLVMIGAGAALAGSEKLRSKVLDTLFGAEEEFQYTPPVSEPAAQPESPVAAA
jgi:hypothetical protein